MPGPQHGASPDFSSWLSGLGSVIETHASWVVLTTDQAFKFKKPVDLGFLDFTTREKREEFCLRELELNRRLAPSVYRRVVSLYRGPEGYVLDPDDAEKDGLELVDHAVAMRRLREQDRADLLLARGELTAEHLRQLAGRLARFQAGIPSELSLRPYGSAEFVGKNALDNFVQLDDSGSSLGLQLAPLRAAQQEFLQSHADLFEARCRAGHVKDGHGDLRLEHVYFEHTDVIVVDCIEFNDRFRFGDTALDLAFLSMDLRRLGHPDLAEDFLAEMASQSGDHQAYALVDFYESYRATVRGKVAAFRALQCSGDPRAEREQEALEFFAQALHAITVKGRPRLVCVGGLIASGKSTLARGLGQALHCAVLDSDSTRKRLHGVAPTTSLAAAPFRDAYSPGASQETYERLQALATAVLQSGRTVIVDASFRTQDLRHGFADLAARLGVPFCFIECSAPESVLRERLRRRAEGPSQSDAREQLLPTLRDAHEPLLDGEFERVLRCDTSGAADVVALAARFVQGG